MHITVELDAVVNARIWFCMANGLENLLRKNYCSHRYYTSLKDGTVKNISATSTYFESLPYNVNVDTGLIDYDELANLASVFKPKLLIMGASAYPRDYEYHLFRQIADDCGALLHCDMAHISGLIAAEQMKSPFEYCDVVTSTTHKTLRGPRSGIIFGKKEIMDAIDFAVFPSLQGGPHNHQIAGVATQLKNVNSPEWKGYCQQVMSNASVLADTMIERGHKLASQSQIVIKKSCKQHLDRDVFCYRISAPLVPGVPTKPRLESRFCDKEV